MDIAIVLFPRLTALDAIGPYEVLQRLPDTDLRFIGHERGEVRTDNGFLGLTVDATFDEVRHPDVIVVPGGIGTRDLMDDEPLLDWLRTAHTTSTVTTSVCTGAMLLAAAGLLNGLTATTHWSFRDQLAEYGAIPSDDRVIEHLDQRIITSAGVSAGIDMALRLSAQLVDETAAKAMQLMIEYDPQPPYDCGSISAADDSVIERAITYFADRQ